MCAQIITHNAIVNSLQVVKLHVVKFTTCSILLGVARGLLQERPMQFQQMFVSKVGNPCPTLGQLLASRILYKLLIGEKQYKLSQARFCTQSCSKVGQLLVNSSPTPHPMGSCRGLPCNSPLATPTFSTMLGTNLSGQIPGGPNLTLTLTLNSN